MGKCAGCGGRKWTPPALLVGSEGATTPQPIIPFPVKPKSIYGVIRQTIIPKPEAITITPPVEDKT